MLERLIWVLPLPRDDAEERFLALLSEKPFGFHPTDDPHVFSRPGVLTFLRIPDEVHLRFTPVVPAKQPGRTHTQVEVYGKAPKALLWYAIVGTSLLLLSIPLALKQTSLTGILFVVGVFSLPLILLGIEVEAQKLRIMRDHDLIDARVREMSP